MFFPPETRAPFRFSTYQKGFQCLSFPNGYTLSIDIKYMLRMFCMVIKRYKKSLAVSVREGMENHLSINTMTDDVQRSEKRGKTFPPYLLSISNHQSSGPWFVSTSSNPLYEKTDRLNYATSQSWSNKHLLRDPKGSWVKVVHHRKEKTCNFTNISHFSYTFEIGITKTALRYSKSYVQYLSSMHSVFTKALCIS